MEKRSTPFGLGAALRHQTTFLRFSLPKPSPFKGINRTINVIIIQTMGTRKVKNDYNHLSTDLPASIWLNLINVKLIVKEIYQQVPKPERVKNWVLR